MLMKFIRLGHRLSNLTTISIQIIHFSHSNHFSFFNVWFWILSTLCNCSHKKNIKLAKFFSGSCQRVGKRSSIQFGFLLALFQNMVKEFRDSLAALGHSRQSLAFHWLECSKCRQTKVKFHQLNWRWINNGIPSRTKQFNCNQRSNSQTQRKNGHNSEMKRWKTMKKKGQINTWIISSVYWNSWNTSWLIWSSIRDGSTTWAQAKVLLSSVL